MKTYIFFVKQRSDHIKWMIERAMVMAWLEITFFIYFPTYVDIQYQQTIENEFKITHDLDILGYNIQ